MATHILLKSQADRILANDSFLLKIHSRDPGSFRWKVPNLELIPQKQQPPGCQIGLGFHAFLAIGLQRVLVIT
jgi:hypothetical protein